MSNTYRVQHCFMGLGGTTDDYYCNQFHFFSATHAPEDAATWGPELAAIVHTLWQTSVSGVNLSRFYSNRCAGNLGVTKIYDVTGAPATAGPPIHVINDATLIPAADYLDGIVSMQGLPEEVAVCLSYRAIHTDGNLPRRRGRIYLGPLNTLAISADEDNNAPVRVSPVLRNVALQSARTMQYSADQAGYEWRVFSTMDGFAFKIVEFSVDDAFDTIRGRGTAPASRDSIAIV